MKKSLILCLASLSSLYAQNETKELPEAAKTAAAVKKTTSSDNSIMIIDAALRAADYKEAFDTLKKDKTANKIAFHLTNGETITSIGDITLSQNGSLLIIKFQTVQGNRYQVIPVETIASLSYQP